MIINRLAKLSDEDDCYWISPKGKKCQITSSGLLIKDKQGRAIPWGDVKTQDLELIISNNERNIIKSLPATKKWVLAKIKQRKLKGEDTEVEELMYLKFFNEKPVLQKLFEAPPVKISEIQDEEVPF